MRNTGLEEAQAGIKIARRNINYLRYADDTTLMAESEEELKSLLMKVKEESEKVGSTRRSRPTSTSFSRRRAAARSRAWPSPGRSSSGVSRALPEPSRNRSDGATNDSKLS